MVAGDKHTAVINAAVIYMLLKQHYSDKGSIPKKLAQSVCESGFQSVPRFSHVESGFQSVSHFSHVLEKENMIEKLAFKVSHFVF